MIKFLLIWWVTGISTTIFEIFFNKLYLKKDVRLGDLIRAIILSALGTAYLFVVFVLTFIVVLDDFREWIRSDKFYYLWNKRIW